MEGLLDIIGIGASAATGGLFGAVVRLLPDIGKGVLGFFQAKADRAHELAMRKLDIEAAREGHEQRIREADTAGNWEVAGKTLDAYREALASQGQITGVRFIDALNQSVRPVVTYYFLALYGLTKFVGFGYAWLVEKATIKAAWPILWSPADSTMLFAILGFWFVDRQLGKEKTAKLQPWTSSRS
jgi:hypothetical protein